jgi:hypothetical protein
MAFLSPSRQTRGQYPTGQRPLPSKSFPNVGGHACWQECGLNSIICSCVLWPVRGRKLQTTRCLQTAGLGAKKNCAGEDQQQYTRPTDPCICCTFSIVSLFIEATFLKLALLPSSGKRMKLILLGPWARANLYPQIQLYSG